MEEEKDRDNREIEEKGNKVEGQIWRARNERRQLLPGKERLVKGNSYCLGESWLYCLEESWRFRGNPYCLEES